MIHKALEVIATWGFEYRTYIVWKKDKIGLGRWARQQHELLLIGRKGEFPPPSEELRSSSVIDAPVSDIHSEKPDIFAEMIERWYPDQPKIELFRRGAARPGWSAWGNETRPAPATESS
jgi:N6-adenosine-specific RNA methylase IME4